MKARGRVIKKLTVFTATLFLLFSCATKKRSEGKYLADIDNADFQPIEPIKYSRDNDYYDPFDLSEGEQGALQDALIEETIQRVPSVKLSDDVGKKDQIYQLANLCYGGNFDQAFALIDELFPGYQKHPGYWNQVGNCYLLQNKLRKAQLFYQQALKIDKKYSPAYNNIGSIHIRNKEYEKAKAAFKKAHELNRRALTPAFNLAQIYLNFGVVDAAQRLLLSIAQQKTGDSSVLSALATTYLFQGKVKKSLSYFNQIAKDAVVRPSIGLNYAVALKIAGENERARDVLSDVRNNKKEWKKYYQKVKLFVRK